MDIRRFTGPAAGVATLYGASVGLLLLSDLALAKTQTRETFGEYQFTRQLIPLLALVSLAGIDQALTRHAAQTRDTSMFRSATRRALLVSLTVSLVSAPAVFLVFDLSIPAITVVLATPALLVTSEMCAAFLRARGSYVAASAVQQGYRVVLAIAALTFAAIGIQVPGIPLILLGGSILAGSVVGVSIVRPRTLTANQEVPRDLRLMGYGFGISMLALAALDWVDQAAVSLRFESIALSGDYAALKLLLVYPFIALSSIVGFLAMPEVAKRSRQINREHLWKAIACLGTLAAVVAIPTGLLLVHFAPQIVARSIGGWTAIVLCIAGVLRFVYVVPSIFFGAIGSTRLILTVSTISLASIPLAAAVIFLMPTDDAVLAGAVGLLISGAFRLAIALYGAQKSFDSLDQPALAQGQVS